MRLITEVADVHARLTRLLIRHAPTGRRGRARAARSLRGLGFGLPAGHRVQASRTTRAPSDGQSVRVSSSTSSILAEQLAYYRAIANEYEDHRIDVPGQDELLAAIDAFRPTGDVLEFRVRLWHLDSTTRSLSKDRHRSGCRPGDAGSGKGSGRRGVGA